MRRVCFFVGITVLHLLLAHSPATAKGPETPQVQEQEETAASDEPESGEAAEAAKNAEALSKAVPAIEKAFSVKAVRLSSKETFETALMLVISLTGPSEERKGPSKILSPKSGETFVIIKWKLEDFKSTDEILVPKSSMALLLSNGKKVAPTAFGKWRGKDWSDAISGVTYSDDFVSTEHEALFTVPKTALKNMKVVFFGRTVPITVK